MAKSIVSIAKGTDPEKMVTEAFDLLGGVTSLFKPNSVVLLKPNIGHPYPAETSVCTNPELVAAAIKVIRKAQPREIIVTEAAATACDTVECWNVSGIRKAAEDAGVDRLIDIKADKDLISVPIRNAQSELTRVLLPRFLIEADHLVNMPVFKSHTCMIFTNALKNIKGLVQDKVHREMHQTDLAQAMFDVWSVCRMDLQIADMIRPQEGFGPHNGLPVKFDCIVVGKDPVAVDATCCRMVGIPVERVPYFKTAKSRGLGVYSENQIEIRGKQIADVSQKMWFPYLAGFDRWPEYKFLTKTGCSNCQSLIAYTMDFLKAQDLYDKNAGMTIVCGPKQEIPEDVDPEDIVLVGNCINIKKNRGKGAFAFGCPPNEGTIARAITTRQDTDGPQPPRAIGSRSLESEMARRNTMVEYQKKLKAAEAKKK